jgi:hypothetical protein
MMKKALLAGVLAVGTITSAPAFAQLKPITIEEVQAAAKTGVPPLLTNEDANRFIDCGLPPIVPTASAEITKAMGEAKAAGVNLQIIWIRHNLKGIEECLARPGNH